jgi:hypothetical protein
MSKKEGRNTGLTPAQQALSDLWDEHVRDEFAIKDANAALDTMSRMSRSCAASAAALRGVFVVALPPADADSLRCSSGREAPKGKLQFERLEAER